ncbi:nuclear transport factor 2 family protein [uncultured Paludibaculum sp.]|uniref:YybH family protein n=1 Tax=uncultured Paludibaculum sp. TaxID=1765020 RepID=UPI002AAC10A5|nr:nuclear transport factor 2 family protein [uncultured Paludibaculum sp.]
MPEVVALNPNVRELQSLDEELARSVRQRDSERLVELFYAEDAELHFAGRPPIQGKDAIHDFWIALFRSGLVDAKLETGQIEADRNIAYGVGRYALTMETHPGLLHTELGKYLVVYRRAADGRWRAAFDCFSPNS